MIASSVAEKFLEVVPAGSTILEIGTGLGTETLTSHFNVLSVEDNIEWHQGISELLYVPVIDIEIPRSIGKRFPLYKQWYDPKLLAEALEGRQYDAILVDGPASPSRRPGFYHYRHLFDLTVPIIFDDAHRTYDIKTAILVARDIRLSKFELFDFDKGGKAFARLLP